MRKRTVVSETWKDCGSPYSDSDDEAVHAAYAHVDSMIPKADNPAMLTWHGWALREAFLHGVNWEREQAKKAETL